MYMNTFACMYMNVPTSCDFAPLFRQYPSHKVIYHHLLVAGCRPLFKVMKERRIQQSDSESILGSDLSLVSSSSILLVYVYECGFRL